MHQHDGFRSSIRLLSVFGIQIRLHFSVLLIFALIVASLGRGVLPVWHPEWTDATRWSAALAAGVLFFVSLLIHELSHALTARARGISTRAITLFLFGGVAEIEKDADRPADEFFIAIAGPLASLALAVLFFFLTILLAPQAFEASDVVEISVMSLPATVMFWLSAVNFMLALFNMVPGFPLDGGRVFRALLWWRSGDMVHATRQAAKGGSYFGWMLVAWGAWNVFSGDTVGGLWLVFIGWFLHRLAHASAAQIIMQRALRGMDIGSVMRTRFEHIPAETNLDAFIADYLLRSSQVLWPVSRHGRDIGYITSSALLSPPDRHTHGLTVEDCMEPLDLSRCLAPETAAKDAFTMLAERTTPVAVIDGDQVVGIVHQSDLLRWLSLHQLER